MYKLILGIALQILGLPSYYFIAKGVGEGYYGLLITIPLSICIGLASAELLTHNKNESI